MKTKRQQIQELKNELATANVLLRAYIQSNHKLQDEVELLNESLNIVSADRDRWRDMAHKADERRRDIVRNMGRTISSD